MSKSEFLQKLDSLASECHALACQLDIGDERTEMFEIYNVLRSLGRSGLCKPDKQSYQPTVMVGWR